MNVESIMSTVSKSIMSPVSISILPFILHLEVICSSARKLRRANYKDNVTERTFEKIKTMRECKWTRWLIRNQGQIIVR